MTQYVYAFPPYLNLPFHRNLNVQLLADISVKFLIHSATCTTLGQAWSSASSSLTNDSLTFLVGRTSPTGHSQPSIGHTKQCIDTGIFTMKYVHVRRIYTNVHVLLLKSDHLEIE